MTQTGLLVDCSLEAASAQAGFLRVAAAKLRKLCAARPFSAQCRSTSEWMRCADF